MPGLRLLSSACVLLLFGPPVFGTESQRESFRQLAQDQRQRDMAWQHFVGTMAPAEALTVYAEVLGKLGGMHPDTARSLPGPLYANGLAELDRALDDEVFRDAHLPGTLDTQRVAFQVTLRTEWKTRQLTTIREARQALYELVREAQATLRLLHPSALVMEFVCGACHSLDDYTSYRPQPSVQPEEASVTEASILPGGDGVGYIKLTGFRDTTVAEFDQAIQALQDQGLESLILDLRGNSGGRLKVALQITSRFQPHGIIVTTKSRLPEFMNRVFSSDSGVTALTLPLVVLIDGKTMSAAEVVASAWKGQRRATLVGQTTYGKGVVQSAPQGLTTGQLIVTVATLFGPRSQPLDGHGVSPHVAEAEPKRQLELAVAKAIELAQSRR